jgi:hypothetical protein
LQSGYFVFVVPVEQVSPLAAHRLSEVRDELQLTTWTALPPPIELAYADETGTTPTVAAVTAALLTARANAIFLDS